MTNLSKTFVAAAAFAVVATSAFSQVAWAGTLDPTGNFYRP